MKQERIGANRRKTASLSALLEAHEIFGRPIAITTSRARGSLYEKAIQLDPEFALAHARLSHVEAGVLRHEPRRHAAQKARTAANEADPPPTRLAGEPSRDGFVNYYIDRDYDAA